MFRCDGYLECDFATCNQWNRKPTLRVQLVVIVKTLVIVLFLSFFFKRSRRTKKKIAGPRFGATTRRISPMDLTSGSVRPSLLLSN